MEKKLRVVLVVLVVIAFVVALPGCNKKTGYMSYVDKLQQKGYVAELRITNGEKSSDLVVKMAKPEYKCLGNKE